MEWMFNYLYKEKQKQEDFISLISDIVSEATGCISISICLLLFFFLLKTFRIFWSYASIVQNQMSITDSWVELFFYR